MRIAIIGGGPAGYDAAQVAAELGAEVTVIEKVGLGGACVLWDCVPSKTLCSTAEVVTRIEGAPALGIGGSQPRVDLQAVFSRVLMLAAAQSNDVLARMEQAGVRVVNGTARFTDPHTIEVTGESTATVEADAVLIATGSAPRQLGSAMPDGERILDSRQVYDLAAVPERLVVVGSGATGAEFAHAFNRLGSHITLVSSRDRVLPGEDADAARVLEEVFERRGMEILRNARAAAVRRSGDGVAIELTDGRVVEGSHALMTVGQVPNSSELGLDKAGVRLGPGGEVTVDGVSRTNVPHIYAAGDVTGGGGWMLASVASMQGRIAMWHALGQAVQPLRLDSVAATVFTDPEIATVGVGEARAAERGRRVNTITMPYATNARAKMSGLTDGFVKIICGADSGIVIGGTVVAPHASDLIHGLSVAVHARMHIGQLAQAFSIYPSLAGTIQEAARRLAARYTT